MTQKAGKTEESAFHKLKHFLGLRGGKTVAVQASNVRQHSVQYVFTAELIKEISKGSPANNRMRTIKDLCEVVQTHKLEHNAVEVLWQSVQDLLQPQTPAEDRQLTYKFFCCLIKGQYEQLGMMRAHFFKVIKMYALYEDLRNRLVLFTTLTNNGKDLQYIEEETGPFLLEWMKDIMSSNKISDFLQLLINIIKYNAAYLDEEIISGIVLNTCMIATRAGVEQDIEQLCLKVLDTIVVYSYLPSASLYHFIVCVCRIVNIEKFSLGSWNLMRRLLGTHLGHSAIYTMCCILQDKNNTTESGAILMRGAVFFVGMALWGSKKVTSLKHPPSAVLPSFLQALEQSESSIVAYEIVLSVQRLVYKYGKEQQMITWDIILSIVYKLLKHVELSASVKPVLVSNIHDLLTNIEELHKQNQFNGNSDRFFSIIETCAHKRPETSILALVQHKANQIHPAKDGWVQNLFHLFEKYYKNEVRTKIRLKVLDILSYVLSANRHLHEDELIETVVLTQLSHVDSDQDVEVRKRAAQLLVDLSHTCQSLHCLDILGVLHRIINRPFTSMTESPVLLVDSSDKPRPLESKMEDILVALTGLVSVFHTKLYQQPIVHGLKIYEMLVGHLEAHYTNDHIIRTGGCLRHKIFTLILELRADSFHRLGLPSKTKLGSFAYSPFALCTYGREGVEQQVTVETPGTSSPTVRSSPSLHPTKSVVISYTQAFKAIRTSIELEKDWNVVRLLLEELPQLLQNKTLVLAATYEDIDCFAARLCAMVSNKGLGLPERYQNTPTNFSKSDFHGYIFPVLTCLVAYHTHLDKHRQTDLVKCLEFGLVSKKARICVDALAVCCLEIQDVMLRQLPSVLLRLTQISATVAMAIPLMEFLSGIIRLPDLYANFVEEQYKSVFAIALPYTNPFKYSHYTVSLAYHVIAMWFVKCKLSFRRKFVPFIVNGLRSNVLRQFEESAVQRSKLNQDSADRSRTHSLNDESVINSRSRALSMNDAVLRKKAAAAKAKLQSQGSHASLATETMSTGSITSQGPAGSPANESMTFHKELMETCIDFMARYTFSTITSMPKRTPVTTFLLSEGQTQSWLIGNKIITITTSGGAKVNARGLCENCYSLARKASIHHGEARNSGELAEEPISALSTRRRHRSAAVNSASEMVPLKCASQDDMTLKRKSSEDRGSLEELMTKSDTNVSGTPSSSSTEDLSGYSLQGPRRLRESKEDKIQIVDSVLMGLKARPSDRSIFSPRMCSCWCVQWAEVHIRRPTGNMAWMMRIENEQDLTEFMDFTLSDLSSLFMGSSEEDTSYEKMMRRDTIDSNCLGDREYEKLMEQHFPPDNEEHSQNGLDIASSSLGEDVEEQMHRSSSTPDMGVVSADLAPLTADSKPLVTSQHTIDTEYPDKTDKQLRKSQSAEEPAKSVSRTNSFTDKGKRKESTSSNETDTVDELVSFEFERSNSVSMKSPRKRLQRKISLPETRRPILLKRATIPDMPSGTPQHGGYNPAFLFLQLFHSNVFDSGEARPLALPASSSDVMRSVKMLDFLHPSETHALGVIYIGPGQAGKEPAILANVYGSSRYVSFLQGLGHLLRLEDCKPGEVYVGGLDLDNNSDGPFAYAWRDDFMQVIYHVATLMPNKTSDPNCNDKKRHIGNDFVTIVYNESGQDYKIGTIKCQFSYVNIVIQPLDNACNAVTVQARDEIQEIIGHSDAKIISDSHLAMLVRQMAVHANLASLILQRQRTNPKDPYASNWLERLRQIKRVKQKVEQVAGRESSRKQPETPVTEDFTDYV